MFSCPYVYMKSFTYKHFLKKGFPGSSAGKQSTCNAGNPGAIPGWGRSLGEGIGYPLHYSWASLVSQMVKNLSSMWETWVWSLGWEDPLEEGMATHFSILAWRIPMDIVAWSATVQSVTESDTTEWLSTAQHRYTYKLDAFIWVIIFLFCFMFLSCLYTASLQCLGTFLVSVFCYISYCCSEDREHLELCHWQLQILGAVWYRFAGCLSRSLIRCDCAKITWHHACTICLC